MRRQRTSRPEIGISSRKRRVAHKALVYQPLNEPPVYQIVHDCVVPSLSVMGHELAPHEIVAFDPSLQGGIIRTIRSPRGEDHVLGPRMRLPANVNR